MVIVNGYIDMVLPNVSSLKGRRAVLNAMREKLKKFNLSQLDISGEYPKEASIAFIFLASDEVQANRILTNMEQMLERSFPECECEMSYEIS